MISYQCILFLFLLNVSCDAFTTTIPHPLQKRVAPLPLVALQNDKFRRDLENKAWERSQGEGAGEVAAGAVLGGLMLGPFGALFGAQLGANFGAKRALDRARKKELERLGVTQEMLDAAEEIGAALSRSVEGLDATKASLDTQQSLARRLDRDVQELYEKAKVAMQDDNNNNNNNEELARKLLLERKNVQEKLKTVLTKCAQEKKRFDQMTENVKALEQRAMEIESLLQRTMGAKARQDAAYLGDSLSSSSSSIVDFSLQDEDPLLKKFRDAGIDK